jgi:alkylated DNA repair dioxygenase AlkB
MKIKNGKMELFENEIAINILPKDGIAIYYGKIISQSEADCYLEKLLKNADWKNDEVVIFGKHIITRRKVAWYADKNFEYTYSNRTKYASPWTKELLELKKIAEKFCETKFNSCLLNLYHNGDEGMAWHSDDEKTLANHSPIASFSFGAERKFSLKHRQTKETISLLLEHGSLLEMKGATQKHWLHCLPKSKKITQPRVNLTFRVMKESK